MVGRPIRSISRNSEARAGMGTEQELECRFWNETMSNHTLTGRMCSESYQGPANLHNA